MRKQKLIHGKEKYLSRQHIQKYEYNRNSTMHSFSQDYLNVHNSHFNLDLDTIKVFRSTFLAACKI